MYSTVMFTCGENPPTSRERGRNACIYRWFRRGGGGEKEERGFHLEVDIGSKVGRVDGMAMGGDGGWDAGQISGSWSWFGILRAPRRTGTRWTRCTELTWYALELYTFVVTTQLHIFSSRCVLGCVCPSRCQSSYLQVPLSTCMCVSV